LIKLFFKEAINADDGKQKQKNSWIQLKKKLKLVDRNHFVQDRDGT
jgi:hypothetical protein